jgi:KUP system potassium uptake protein
VYGDIAPVRFTPSASPWEAADSVRSGERATPVLGVLSMIVWALVVVVTVKYVLVLLRADNNGEGGTPVVDGARRRAGSGSGPCW